MPFTFKLLLERLSLHLTYFFKKVDAHSLQAPFAYDFYSVIKNGKGLLLTGVERKRSEFLHSKQAINYHSFGQPSSLAQGSRSKLSSIAKRGISDVNNSLLLAAVIRKFNSRTIVELGTSLGLNTCYLAEAAPDGEVITFEGHPELSEMALDLFNEQAYDNIRLIKGNIDETFSDFVESIEKLDFIFMDANHSSEAMLRYFNILRQKLHENSVAAIDDIRWNKDMYQGWKKLTVMDAVSHSFDFGDIGFLFFKETRAIQRYIIEK